MPSEEDRVFLDGLLPDFWWFRDSHYKVGESVRITGTIMVSERYTPADIVGYANGNPVEIEGPLESAYADRVFCFIPPARRFGFRMEIPVSPSTVSLEACFVPKGTDITPWISGQFLDWQTIDPTPPVVNIERVSGKGATAYNYYNNGLTDFLRFIGVARANGIDLSDPDTRVLDWGCGCGRLTRHLIAAAGTAENIVGIDIDPDNIAWSRENLSQEGFRTVGLYPPTPFEDASFDLIIANSVLSHLQYQTTHDWIAEMARLLRPGGIALLSYHGDFSLGTVLARNPAFARRVHEEGFNCDLAARELEGLVPDPEYYRQTFMSDRKAAGIFSEYLRLKTVHKGMVSRYQNVAVLENKGRPSE